MSKPISLPPVPKPPLIGSGPSASFGDPEVQEALAFLRTLKIRVTEKGFDGAFFGHGPSGLCVQILCSLREGAAGLWTIEAWRRSDGVWSLLSKSKQKS